MPSPKNVPCVCQNCGKTFLERKTEIARGNGKYCNKRCWSRKFNAPRIHASGVSRRQRKRIRRDKVRRDPLDNSVLNPFAWLRKWKRDPGRPKDSTYTSYGHVEVRCVGIPSEIYVAVNALAKMKGVSVSQLVSGFCVGGIVRGKHVSLLQRAYKYRRPVTEDEQRLDWTTEGIAELERMSTEGQESPARQSEDLITSLTHDCESPDSDDYTQE